MKTLSARQSGFSPILIIVVIVAVGLIGYLGYLFFTNSQQQVATTVTEQSAVAKDVQTAPEVTSTSDLDAALTAIEGTDTASGKDNTELDSQLSEF
jgi:Tfp pilus assembly protein PilV